MRRTYWPQGYRPRHPKIPGHPSRKPDRLCRVAVGVTQTSARDRLEALRAATLERLAALQGEHRAVVDASRDSNADDEHDPEGATIAFERAQVDALARDAIERLASVDAAIARLDDGSYGICTVCGQPIAAARLEARPTATTCVGCAAR
ncbi:TraR/DksA family transcriptional regulator [Cellulomonas humilata]|uniref:TraR/DksA family transcriptional regulator n=1 Tax=Cellulomonas humilata TaxID=144055 RepID=A0A7Y6A385_9CELL|nr:TraR/DksA family transcriptional regulator [Cellulomonas humilata]